MIKSGLWLVAMFVTACATTPRPTEGEQDLACQDVPGERASQLYDPARIRHAAPVYTQRFVARAIQPREVTGVELYLDAVDGVSPAYLERVLSCHAGTMSTTHVMNDPLRVSGVDIDVRGEGPYFVVTVRGKDRAAGQQAWAKAQALMSE